MASDEGKLTGIVVCIVFDMVGSSHLGAGAPKSKLVDALLAPAESCNSLGADAIDGDGVRAFFALPNEAVTFFQLARAGMREARRAAGFDGELDKAASDVRAGMAVGEAGAAEEWARAMMDSLHPRPGLRLSGDVFAKLGRTEQARFRKGPAVTAGELELESWDLSTDRLTSGLTDVLRGQEDARARLAEALGVAADEVAFRLADAPLIEAVRAVDAAHETGTAARVGRPLIEVLNALLTEQAPSPVSAADGHEAHATTWMLLDAIVARLQGGSVDLEAVGPDDGSGSDVRGRHLMPKPKDDPLKSGSAVRNHLVKQLGAPDNIRDDEIDAILDELRRSKGRCPYFASDDGAEQHIMNEMARATPWFRDIYFRKVTTHTSLEWRVAIRVRSVLARQTQRERSEESEAS